MTENWQVFQQDVLDVLRQYEGFFDFFERVGSLSDDSRPDCVARISREGKKEVWLIDAKNKQDVNESDLDRMNRYMEMLESNPIDICLELSEISEYEFRGIFVTPSGETEIDGYERVKFSRLHQFLQRELIYTDIDRVVRDVSKMAERKQLSQSQARLLFRSLKPFEDRLNHVLHHLEQLETKYVGLKLLKPPLNEFDFKVPVDAVLVHSAREKAFLIDIPYSRDDLDVEEKVEQVKKRMTGLEKELYYAAVDTFSSGEKKYVYPLDALENEIRETAGIVSPDEIAGLFTPKIPTEKEYHDSFVEITDTENIGFMLRVKSTDDVKHVVEARIPDGVASSIKDNAVNSRKNFGELSGRRFTQEIEVTNDLDVLHDGTRENWSDYRDAVRSIYGSAVNRALSQKVKRIV